MAYYFRVQPDGIPNLRQHMRNCVLPPLGYREHDPLLPPEGHVSHENHLAVRPETYRRFENIHSIDDSVWLALEHCLDKLIPATAVGRTRRLTNIRQMSPFFHSTLTSRPEYLQGLTPWLEKFPFATVKRILHLSIPETRSWSFSLSTSTHPEPDSNVFATYTWAMNFDRSTTRARARERQLAQDRRMLVAVQPPWILTQRDLEEFADCRNFPPFVLLGEEFPESLDEAKDRLWAKVWDSCAREKIHYFVLTSYTHWVFGVFSPGYSTARTSQVLPFRHQSPSIVEMLSYWAISAMGIDGGYVPPQVSEPFHQFPATIHPPRLPHQCVDPEDSESSWAGSAIDSEDSAEICPSLFSTSQGEDTYEAKMYDTQKNGENPPIEEWVRRTLAEGSRSSFEIETTDKFVDPMGTIPYVIEVYREPRLRGEQAALVGNWLF